MQTRYGDLWEVNGFHVIPTNLTLRRDGTAVMGRGVAQQAVLRSPALAWEYGRFLQATTQPQLFVDRGFRVICLPVKHHWSQPADLGLIAYGVQQLAALPRQMAPIVLPLLGCGCGALFPDAVLSVLKQYLVDDRFVLVLRDAAATQRHAATLRPATRSERTTARGIPAPAAPR